MVGFGSSGLNVGASLNASGQIGDFVWSQSISAGFWGRNKLLPNGYLRRSSCSRNFDTFAPDKNSIAALFFMKVVLKKYTDFIPISWSGGTTTELTLFPESASYGDRAFDWRISTATIKSEQSNFTQLPGFRRIILPLQGDLTLHHLFETETQAIHLKPFEQYTFEGAWQTTSEGKVIDFNLMLSRRAEGNVQVLRDLKSPAFFEIENKKENHAHFIAFYAFRNRRTVRVLSPTLEKDIEMQEKDFLLIQLAAGEDVICIINPDKEEVCDMVVTEVVVLVNESAVSGPSFI